MCYSNLKDYFIIIYIANDECYFLNNDDGLVNFVKKDTFDAIPIPITIINVYNVAAMNDVGSMSFETIIYNVYTIRA